MQKSYGKNTPSRRQTFRLQQMLLTLLTLSAVMQYTYGFKTPTGEPRKLFGGYRITPKQCRATKTLPSTDPRANGPTICMFNHECAQRNGEVVGACMDGFLFGACCQVPKAQEPESTLINDAQNAYYHQYQQHKLQQQESETNKIVSQAYETFAENSAQAQSQSHEHAASQTLEEDLDQIHSNYNSQQQQHHDILEEAASSNTDSSTEGVKQYYSSTETDMNIQSSTESQEIEAQQPPKKNTHKNSGTMPTTSQATNSNDDFVLQLLHSTNQPEGNNQHMSFTTEIPTKIVSSLTQQVSSESDSFEEEGGNSEHHLPSTQQQENDALFDAVTFSHSDITHPAADAILLDDDLQFSTGYGPQPVFIKAPTKYNSSTTDRNAVLNSHDGTTSSTTASSITTHVDSIETIIQQLNPESNNPGPAYNVISPQSSTFAYEVVNSTNTPALEYDEELSTTNSEHNEKQTATPLYGGVSEETSATSVHYEDELYLDDHTLPGSNYNDQRPSNHPTSDFNKMPVMGIAYPVDMSHMEDDSSNIADEKQTIGNINNNYQAGTHMGVVTSQNYNKPQVPPEVVVSSHTTQVEESPDTSVAYTPITSTTHKITTTLHLATTLKPVRVTSRPTLVTKRPGNKKPSKGSSNKVTSSGSSSSTQTKTPATSPNYRPSSVSLSQNQHSGSTPKPAATRKPTKKQTIKPISTSYVTGPTTPRPTSNLDFHYDSQPSFVATDDKLDSFVHSTAQSLASAGSVQESPSFSDSPIPVLRPQPQYNTHKKPGFVKIPATQRPVTPTVLITPKPNIINTAASSLADVQHTTASPGFGSTSYIYSALVTRRPGLEDNAAGDYIGITTVNSNDFDDPGYYGTPESIKQQARPPLIFLHPSTEGVYPVPSDDKPAFPGYYGPTPTYPAFQVPGEKVSSQAEEETYTSPNDFVNFPPVRNPNLNMSATSSAVTNDLELSTPAFVEDTILKNKMNTLVHKLMESLQGNFEALADMIDESNDTAPILSYQASTTAPSTSSATKKPTRKTSKVTTPKPKATTKKPATRVSTKAPTKKPATTRKPESTTKKPVVRRTTTTTRKPSTRKPTRKVTTTTKAPLEDELVDEEDEEDVNPNENEINPEDEAQSGAGAGGRKIQCGVRPHIKSGRIVGGKGATFGAYPWQVLVRESTWLGLFTKNKCGGVLITNRYVITAAHCQPGFLASLVAVMGEFDISGDLESKRATTKNVKRVIVHRQYDPATFENDIALLELDSPVQFDTHIVPICMPTDVADFTGRMATVTGWGRLKYGGGVPSVLQEVQVPVIENSVCQEMFHTAGHNKKILNSFLCAGYANGQKDSCEGDSGGPLVLQRPDGRYELAGTVSHGIKCAAPYLPGVYMRTTYYKPWLRSITGVK